jgi:hypothetical protein
LPSWHVGAVAAASVAFGVDSEPAPDITTMTASAATAVSTRLDRTGPRETARCKTFFFIFPSLEICFDLVGGTLTREPVS